MANDQCDPASKGKSNKIVCMKAERRKYKQDYDFELLVSELEPDISSSEGCEPDFFEPDFSDPALEPDLSDPVPSDELSSIATPHTGSRTSKVKFSLSSAILSSLSNARVCDTAELSDISILCVKWISLPHQPGPNQL